MRQARPLKVAPCAEGFAMQPQQKGPERPVRKQRRALIALLPAAILVAGSGLLWQARSDTPAKQGGKAAEPSVRTATVRSGTLEQTIRLTGTTAPERYASLLAPQLRGSRRGPGGGGGGGGGGFDLILQKVAEPGSRVKKGDVVAEFDRQFMLLRLDDYRASLDQQEANLLSLKANLDLEKETHNRSVAQAKAELDKARHDLKTIPVQSAIVSERLKLAEQEAAARYKLLLSEVKFKDIAQQAQWRVSRLEADQNKLEFQRSQANADRLVFRAPIDGLVVMGTIFRQVETKQIMAGDEVRPGTMFMRIVDPSSMVVNALANQADIDSVRVGARVKVQFDAYPDLELPGRVSSIAAMPKTAGFRADYVREIPVNIRLERLDPRVVPDLSVSADVVIEAAENAVIVPLEAVFQDEPGGETYVFVRRGAGWERRPVEIALKNNVEAAIRSGLQPGEVVAAERPDTKQTK